LPKQKQREFRRIFNFLKFYKKKKKKRGGIMGKIQAWSKGSGELDERRRERRVETRKRRERGDVLPKKKDYYLIFIVVVGKEATMMKCPRCWRHHSSQKDQPCESCKEILEKLKS
jgi:hypothetical protein